MVSSNNQISNTYYVQILILIVRPMDVKTNRTLFDSVIAISSIITSGHLKKKIPDTARPSTPFCLSQLVATASNRFP
jgi:hypothetical protein